MFIELLSLIPLGMFIIIISLLFNIIRIDITNFINDRSNKLNSLIVLISLILVLVVLIIAFLAYIEFIVQVYNFGG